MLFFASPQLSVKSLFFWGKLRVECRRRGCTRIHQAHGRRSASPGMLYPGRWYFFGGEISGMAETPRKYGYASGSRFSLKSLRRFTGAKTARKGLFAPAAQAALRENPPPARDVHAAAHDGSRKELRSSRALCGVRATQFAPTIIYGFSESPVYGNEPGK